MLLSIFKLQELLASPFVAGEHNINSFPGSFTVPQMCSQDWDKLMALSWHPALSKSMHHSDFCGAIHQSEGGLNKSRSGSKLSRMARTQIREGG